MRHSLSIGKVFDVEIGIHYSWIFVAALVVWSLAVGYFPQQFPDWPNATYWITASIASLLLFLSVLAHELAHSVVAMRRGMPVEGITLFIFGGVSNITEEAKRPSDELLMSIVGPLASFGIAVGSAALLFITRGWNQQLTAVLLYLATVNILLSLFNLIPGFPLDGGRVLRSLIWAFTGNQARATQAASLVGRGIAYLFVFAGLFLAFGGSFFGFQGDFLSGIWLVFIGWFLANASGASSRQARLEERFRGVTVEQLMSLHPVSVRPEMSVRQLVDDYFLRFNLRVVPVVQEERLIGEVSTDDIKDWPAQQWGQITVGEAMGGWKGLKTVRPEDDVSDAMQVLEDDGLSQLLVVEEGRLVGMLTRTNLLGYLQLREELGQRA